MISDKRYVPDAVGRPLTVVLKEFTNYGVTFVVHYTEPPKNKFALLDNERYVLRQRTQVDGIIQITAGAKMARENHNEQESGQTQDRLRCKRTE